MIDLAKFNSGASESCIWVNTGDKTGLNRKTTLVQISINNLLFKKWSITKMVTGGLGSRHEWAADGYFVAPKIKSFIRQYTLEDSHNFKISRQTVQNLASQFFEKKPSFRISKTFKYQSFFTFDLCHFLSFLTNFIVFCKTLSSLNMIFDIKYR